MATRIVAVRHGETAWNVDTRIQGQLDIPLNDRGRWQAQQLAVALADEGIDAVYASDLSRAHETANAIAEAAGLHVKTEPCLRERGFGEFEGRTWAEIEAETPEASARWRARDVGFAPDGGETLVQLFDRVLRCATALALAHPDQTIALVAHGGVMDCLYRAAAGVGLEGQRTWQLGNAAINRLLFSDGRFVLIGWSDTAHLETSGNHAPSNGQGAPSHAGQPEGDLGSAVAPHRSPPRTQAVTSSDLEPSHRSRQ